MASSRVPVRRRVSSSRGDGEDPPDEWSGGGEHRGRAVCACEAVDQLGHPCRDQQARPGQLDNGAARGERERVASQRGDSGDVDLPRQGR